jgi:hypothetical protein
MFGVSSNQLCHSHYTYFSVIVGNSNTIHVLDVAAKLDQTADFICRPKWGEIAFPPPFGREAYPEVKICTLYSARLVITSDYYI